MATGKRQTSNRRPPSGPRPRPDQVRVREVAAFHRRRAQRRRLVAAVVASIVLVLGVTALVGGGGGPDEPEPSAATTTSAPGRKPVTLQPVPVGATLTGDTPCPAADGSSPRTSRFAKAPPMCIDPARSYTAEMKTSKGAITIALDAKAAPRTVNNFVVLARYRYYDGIPFHRIIPGFVIQVGDPDANGSGGPGYRFADELPAAGSYRIGSVAMANSGPATNGSQIFIVTGPEGAALQPSYSLFGQVTAGLDVAAAIEEVGIASVPGDPNSGKPTELITIDSITIKEQ